MLRLAYTYVLNLVCLGIKMVKKVIPKNGLGKYETGDFRLSDIRERCMREQIEELTLINKMKSRIAYEIYMDFYDKFNNANNIENTKATEMVIDIQRILLDWNLEITDDLDAIDLIEKIMDVFKKNNIFIAREIYPFSPAKKK